ncbi:MAG: SMP-30/gluconolactonase/LRE family protein [Planctomycetota bacterium]|jgi:gluconolactonase|nr:SMP-30/gluconolactonase/LRE family protein [Planctomycetota bacterium]
MSAEIEIIDPSFADAVRPDSRLERLASPAIWAEGPVWLPDRDVVVFSDVKGNRMFAWSERKGLEIFRQPSNYNNGNTLDRQGRLVSCEHGRRCVSRTEPDGRITVLAEKFDGRRFNSPNDVVVKSDGSVWFTDPPYGIAGDDEGYKSESQIVGCWVYRLEPDGGRLEAAVVDVQRPNGLAFSPDESILYVADMSLVDFPRLGRRQITAYDLPEGGNPVNGRKLADIEPGIPDGFRVDREGRIFTSSDDGIQVVSPAGRLLGKIKVPERVSNCTFAGRNEDTLYITATTSLYRIRLAARGVQYSHLL